MKISITKEENSDFDDNQATQPGTGEPAAVSSLAPAGSGGPTNDKGGEDKVTINCTASTPLLGEKTEGFSSLMNPTGLSPGHHMGGSSSLGRGEGSGGSNLNIASLATPTGGPREGPCGSPGIAMQYLNQMGKPMESNLLLPPNLMRRGMYVREEESLAHFFSNYSVVHFSDLKLNFLRLTLVYHARPLSLSRCSIQYNVFLVLT